MIDNPDYNAIYNFEKKTSKKGLVICTVCIIVIIVICILVSKYVFC